MEIPVPETPDSIGELVANYRSIFADVIMLL